jgi:phosphate-selective porin OprO/OprP
MSLLGVAGLGLASSAQGQQVDYPPVQPVAAATAPQQTGPSPIEDLERRLDEQSRQIQQLQTQLNGGTPSGTPATAAGFASGPSGNTACPCGPDGIPMCKPDPAGPPCCVEVNNDKTPMKAYWSSGVWLASTDDDFKVHFGGRIQFDAFDAFDVSARVRAGISGGSAGFGIPYFDESQGFRRDRVRMEGTIYDSVDFVWEYDFATAMNPKNFQAVQGTTLVAAQGSSVFTGTGITDMNVTLKYIPYIQNVSVGSFLVPFSFELATSDRWMDFIERSAAFDSFVPATNFANYTLGARTFGWNEAETFTYAASASMNNFWDGASGFDYGNDPMFTGRVTALPYYDASTAGRYMLEVGLSGNAFHCQADPLAAGAPDATQLRSRLATREYLSPLTPSITNTGTIDGKEQYTEGAEVVGQYGPVSFQSEFYASQVTDDNGAGGVGTEALGFKGCYAEVMYFLTGENRNYNRQRANWERVVPYEDWVRVPGEYGRACGHGAWQIGARYSYVDLNDKAVHGGQESEFTLGLNWFLNPNLKFQFNYDATYRDEETVAAGSASNGWINGFGTRMCLDF